MTTNNDIRGIIFDYGGTIDSRGDHWSEVIYDQYIAHGLTLDWETFKPAYIHAERYLATHPLIKSNFTFADLMRVKIAIEMEYLAQNGIAAAADKALAETIADGCYRHARTCVGEAAMTLKALAEHYPLVAVSNFYGNIDSVLRDFDIRQYFRGVIESAVVGVRKPDPRIFTLGCVVLDLPAEQVLVVGDSISKDISPARSIGCHTAWIRGRQWRDDDPKKMLAEKSTTLPEIANALLRDFKN